MTYDSSFFDYVDQGAIRSAEIIVSKLAPLLKPASVLDVGCGRGGWANIWKQVAAAEICGIDGAHVDKVTLYIESAEFVVADLAMPFDIGARFDLVQCLEVAEHLPALSAEGLIDSIVRHGDIVLFGAAVPGQGGTHHVNERPIAYWRDRFAAHGYAAFDYLRPEIYRDLAIEPWYRFNPLLYANATGQQRLSAEILRTRIQDGAKIPDFAPWSWQLRKAAVRLLPATAVNQLARFNAMIARKPTR